ncbi:MAG: envelope stress response membrane protein PspC [Solidesulfovibrio sp.]|uniref:envelope stress response membrane protein PspC n=1 Tax=Solidesulfovibrio sp. TaxID=2910990 RepID=UPI002B1F7FF2|nr:envelope stress response membrane protein PspC [Solidesulfovibrio sp.]MEA4858772.1 envelope stress response membrane protein PspC [Solidesulfovibrio sp.]
MRHYSELRLGELYRSRSGLLLGVCKGLARFLDVPVFWLRVLVLVLTPFTGIWPMVAAYLIAGFVIKPEPVIAPDSDEERAFYDDYVTSRANALTRVKRRFERLDKRIRRLEDHVTSREFDFDRRLRHP